MDVMYVAMDAFDGEPIRVAPSIEALKKALDEYYGVDKFAAKYLGYTQMTTEDPVNYQGFFEYEAIFEDDIDTFRDRIKVYCVDYYSDSKS